MYKYLFGPVPSRRLGMSLGVDLVPKKVCSLDCIYCECGKTTKLTTQRLEYIPFEKIKTEFIDYFDKNPAPDYITFSGNGEPTLNSRFGEVMDFIKQFKPDIPVAVLTNGTLLWDKQVRNEMLKADVVLPSLDAATVKDFIAINKPAADLNLDKYIEGLIKFRQEFKGKIWLEVMFIPGINDDDENILSLQKIIRQINPDKVQINTLDRPGTDTNIRAATHYELKHILQLLDLPNAEIIAAAPDRKKIIAYRTDTENAILETIERRPCTLDDLHKILGLNISEINKYLGVLENEGKITAIKLERGFFYKIKT